MDVKKKEQPFTDSEIQRWREADEEREHRRWLWKMIRTGAAWAVGTLAALLSLAQGAKDAWTWLKS
jgi:hypothetical protein